MNGKIKGWSFLKKLSADGSEGSTRSEISAEKIKLEARLVQIPRLISGLTQSNATMQSDVNWLSSLSKSRQRKWEKENGRHPHVASAELEKKINSNNAQMSALVAEKNRIPARIENLQKQLDALVKGESSGLSKGLDKESAKALGELELQKQQTQLEFEQRQQEQILQQAELENKKKQASSSQTKWVIGISAVVILAIIAFVIYKSNANKQILKPLAL